MAADDKEEDERVSRQQFLDDMNRGLDAHLTREFRTYDPDGNGTATHAEIKQELLPELRRAFDQTFRRVDRNGDGFIDREEYSLDTGTPAFGFEGDVNGDLKMSREEFMNGLDDVASETADDIIRPYDTNADGVVTREEYIASMRETMQPLLNGFFDMTDTNRDGFLDRDEIGAGPQFPSVPSMRTPPVGRDDI